MRLKGRQSSQEQNSELVICIDCLATRVDSFNDIPVWTDLLSNSCDKHPPMVLTVNKIDRPDQPYMSCDAIKEKYERSFRAIFSVYTVTGELVDDVFHHFGECAFDFLFANEMIVRPHVHVEVKAHPKESVVRRNRGGCSLRKTQL